MSRVVLAVILGLGTLSGWLATYTACLRLTRPHRPSPAPPSQDLGDDPEPPAVVSLLVEHWTITEDAAEATLLDLAARRILELRQPGNDPAQTTVHVREPHPDGLNAYERLVFDRVAGLAIGGVVPLTALTFRDPGAAATFAKRLGVEVRADARRRGLSRRRFGRAVTGCLTAAALLAGVGVAVAVLVAVGARGKLPLIGFAWLFSTVLLAGIGLRDIGDRDTPAGIEAAARWLGVRAWLRNTEAFGELPPSAIAVWDRYLAYGAAVGATRVASAVIDLGLGDRSRVWSSFGGAWHRVRVTYPRFWLRYGQQARPIVLRGLVAAGIGVLLLRFWSTVVAYLPGHLTVSGRPVSHVPGAVRPAGLALGALLLGYGGYVLIRTVIDLATPVTSTGQVLWMQVWRSQQRRGRTATAPLYYLAVDAGHADRTRAWALPSAMSTWCRAGDTVTIKAHRWTRRVDEITVVAQGTLAQVEAAERATGAPNVGTDTATAERLIAAAMGLPVQRRPGATGPVPGRGAAPMR